MSSQSPSSGPAFKIAVSGEETENLSFNSHQEILDWMTTELSFWSWLKQVGVFGTELTNSTNKFRAALSKLELAVSQCAGVAINLSIPQSSEAIAYYFDVFKIHSRSNKAVILEDIRKQYGEISAAAVLCHIRGLAINMNRQSVFWAVLQFHFRLNGMTHESNASIVRMFEQTRETEEQKFNEFERKANAFLETLSKSEQRAEKIKDRFLRRHSAMKRWGSRSWNKFRAEKQKNIEAGIEQLKQVEKTYTEQMKLAAPAQYWTDKANEHGKRANTKGKLLFTYAIFASLVFTGTIAFAVREGFLAKEAYLVAALIVFISTALIWIGRILVRLYMSEVHLQMDANQRITMIMTYLALTKDNQVEKSERELVLAPLFNPTNDGIIKDDGAPMMSIGSLLSSRDTR